jgi:sugar lactone lactonase YvrE
MNPGLCARHKALGRLFAALLLGTSWSVLSQSQLQVGFAVIAADPGASLPVGTALFSYSNSSGVLVSQAGVGAVEPANAGRIFVDETGTQTGIALANPSAQEATVSLVLRDATGREVERKDQPLAAREHMARYVSQLFPNLAPGFTGSLSFQSDAKVAAITLRESRNSRGEPVYATLPVASPGQQGAAPVVFPHVAAGGGYRTQLVLLNSTGQTMKGKVRFTASNGTDLALRLAGATASEFSYEITPQGTYRAELDKSGPTGAGYAVLTPDPGTASPAGTVIFQYLQDGSLVTEAGVAAAAETSLARIFIDNATTYTGVALANPATQTAVVAFSLLDRYGTLLDTATRTIAARNHVSVFAHELFPGLSDSFTGLMEISSTVAASVVTLRQTENSRGEQVLTTLPVADLTRLSSATSMTFPHIANGEGFSTRLIFINTITSRPSGGRLSFYESSGGAMVISLGGKSGSEFTYDVPGAGGRQFLPGNSAKVAAIDLTDAISKRATREVVVNEGNRVRATVRVLDSSGLVRDDFDLNYRSLDTDVATVDATGSIEGKRAGFSTFTIESGGVVTTGTITVVRVDAGVSGFGITGIVQDLSRRLYLANTSDHTILRTESLQQAPQPYAGVAKTAGLRNDLRSQSWFRNPAFLALDQSNGNLYVADSANHVIRRIPPGPSAKVETLAGSGDAGSNDGERTVASFRNPQGLQLDTRGRLWVVDSGNHTIRRINLATGTVETVAGKAGSSGWVDGSKEQALFSSPRGIALETESIAQQLDRERRGDPPPPVSLLVADTGNGVIRRVLETGEAQTIRSGGESAALRVATSASAPAAPLLFDSPEGIAVDSSSNVFVSEPGTGRVRTILSAGEVVDAAQANTFKSPKGLAITQTGKIVVAESNVSAREISYGPPQITRITPSRVGARGGSLITIQGKNFAPDTRIAIAGTLIAGAKIADTSTISATLPVLPSGNGTVTVENRGGVAQAALLVDAIPLSELLPGQITTVAGGSTYFGDGGAATAATLSEPADVAVDAFGNLLIADSYNNRIRKVHSATGIITTLAGTGIEGSSGDGGPSFIAQISHPPALAVDPAGNLVIADSWGRAIRRVDAATGIITTLAQDQEPATDITVDSAGNVLVCQGDINWDPSLHRVLKIDPRTGIKTIVAGTGTKGYSGDGGAATQARLSQPAGVVLDPDGNLWIADSGNHVIRRVDAKTGTITTVAGTGIQGSTDGPAASAQFRLPSKMTLDTEGNFLIAEFFNSRIRRFSPSTGIVTTVAGPAGLKGPAGVTVDSSGNLFIVDLVDERIRRVDGRSNTMTTIAGIGPSAVYGDNGPATAAPLSYPERIAVDRAGNLIFADSRNHKVRKVDRATGTITTVAGTGQSGYAGNNGPASAALLDLPSGVAIDGEGNVYITEAFRVRKITAATGIITTVAGASQGNGGDGGLATLAQLNNPTGIALDADGNLLIADRGNHKVRRIDARTQIITTVAGTGAEGFSGDNGPASACQLSNPNGVAVDASRNLLIADSDNGRVRKVWAATGIITTVAGNGAKTGISEDNVPATASRLLPQGDVLVDSAGNILIAGGSKIRRVDAATGIITTIAGTSQAGFSGDGGAATAARLHFAIGLALGPDGTLYVSDKANLRIRAIRGPIR